MRQYHTFILKDSEKTGCHPKISMAKEGVNIYTNSSLICLELGPVFMNELAVACSQWLHERGIEITHPESCQCGMLECPNTRVILPGELDERPAAAGARS